MNFYGKMHTISVLLEGRKCYLKVTKNTTCGDVIQHLLNCNGLNPNDKDSYFLIMSNNMTEKQLSNNANIPNVNKDLMSETNRLHFIMRKKTRLFVPKISIAKRRRLREKSSAKEQKVEQFLSTRLDTPIYESSRKASEQTRGVKRLYQLVQEQKRRLSEVYQRFNGTAKLFKQTMRKKAIHSKADTSPDQFRKNVNKEMMQGFLSFDDVVATKEMENLSSVLPTSSSVDRSVMNCSMRLMPHMLESPLIDYTPEYPLVNETGLSELNNDFEDVLLLDDKLFRRGKGEGSFGTMPLPPSRRLTIGDPSRLRRNNKPLHSTPLANKTMTYLNKSRKPTRMMRQFGSARLPLDRLTKLTPKEIPICDSNLNRRPDGDLSMFICQRRSAFSSQKDKCKYFWEQSYVSDLDDNLNKILPDKEFDDTILNNFDDDRNVSTRSASSFNVLSRKLANDDDNFTLAFDRSPREFPHVHDVREKTHDGLNLANLKMKLVNYSLSDSDISSISCESVAMSRDCKKTPYATFTRDYVTRFENSPECGSDTGPSSFGSDAQIFR